MPLTMLLLTLGLFVVGVALGWRFRVSSALLLAALVLAFAVLDFAVDRIVVWPYKYWLIVDLIAIQIGYVVGAAIGFFVTERKQPEASGQG
jgi:VanZ family protein